MRVFLFLTFTGCSTIEESDTAIKYTKDLSAIKINNGIVVIPNKDYLIQIVLEYKKSSIEQENFIAKIKEYQNSGFRPLTPCFEGLSNKQIQEFVKRKKRESINVIVTLEFSIKILEIQKST